MAPTLKRRRSPPHEDQLGEPIKRQEEATGNSSSYLIKAGAIAFVLGGLGWIAGYPLYLRFTLTPAPFGPVPIQSSLWLSIATVVLSVVGLVGLHALQRGSYAGLGRAGFYTILAASAASVVAGVAHLFGSAALEWLVYPVGMVGIMVGFLLYGVATVQARVLPRWYGVVLIAYLPISVFLGVYAYIWIGVVQLVLGSVLWRRRAGPKENGARVHGLRTTENAHSARLGI